MTGITAVILTKNEALRIRRCLDALKGWADEIIIVDDESIDNTCTIAKEEYGARVIVRALENAFDKQRNCGMEAAQTTWVLQMDADEVIPAETKELINQAIKKTDHAAFEILRQDCVGEIALKHVGGAYQLKLLQKGKGTYQGNIHEAFVTRGSVGRIQGIVLHYAIGSVSQMLAKQNHYSDLESERYLREHPEIDVKKIKHDLIFKTPSIFFKHYVKRGGFKDGLPGLVWSVIHTMHPMMFWLKVLEKMK
ncbi:MAG: glycosyltransferase family 2 protein [Candidatus Omnitrophica bacterium]|nr:glycosyltransferase family 2 protein [Candidatus Omnitrophota bacterium]